MFKKTALFIFILLALYGCTGMADSMTQWAGVGVVTEEKSTFDNAAVVKVSPAFLFNGKSTMGCSVKLGARWTSSSPNLVALLLAYDSDVRSGKGSYTNISGLDINIGGNIISYETVGLTDHSSSSYNTVSQTIYTESNNTVVIPYDIFKKMINAKDCRLRIHTSEGYEDAIFSIERSSAGQSAALFHMREFLEKIEANKMKT